MCSWSKPHFTQNPFQSHSYFCLNEIFVFTAYCFIWSTSIIGARGSCKYFFLHLDFIWDIIGRAHRQTWKKYSAISLYARVNLTKFYWCQLQAGITTFHWKLAGTWLTTVCKFCKNVPTRFSLKAVIPYLSCTTRSHSWLLFFSNPVNSGMRYLNIYKFKAVTGNMFIVEMNTLP